MAKKYDWKITAKKFLWAFVEVVIAGALVYTTEHVEFLALVPVIEGIKNWIKHK